MTKQLVLASESVYRRVLLDRLGLSYVATSHECDERALPPLPTFEEHAIALAKAKAESLKARYPKAFIIGSDQMAVLDDEVLHKPGNAIRAREQLAKMAGRRHRLLTAITLLGPDGSERIALDVHQMRMRSLDAGEIQRYVDADQPFDCCGSYKIESLGVSLFDSIEGDDFTAITGMPMIALCRLLRDAGFQVP